MARKPKLCELCGGCLEIVVRPTRVIGATYPEDDKWKGDEHLEPCPLCWQSPLHMAKGTGQVIVTRMFGPIMGVYYPHRKSPDCYVAGPDDVIKCCQEECGVEFPAGELSDHIDFHDTRKGKRTITKKKLII